MNHQQLIKYYGFTPRHLQNGIDRLNDRGKKIAEQINHSKSFIFYGASGTGKTHIAQSILFDNVINGKTGIYCQLFDFIADMRKAINLNHAEHQIILKRIIDIDLLIIDEIVSLNDFALEQFFYVINKRYDNIKPTILISNREAKELSQIITMRVVSRFVEDGGGFIEFKGDDKRLKKNESR